MVYVIICFYFQFMHLLDIHQKYRKSTPKDAYTQSVLYYYHIDFFKRNLLIRIVSLGTTILKNSITNSQNKVAK